MYKTLFAIQVTFHMREFGNTHTAVCRRLFITKDEAESNVESYIKEVIALCESKAQKGESIFTLSGEGVKYGIIEMDVPLDI